MNLLEIVNGMLGSYPFLFAAVLSSLSVKSYLLIFLIIHGLRSITLKQQPWIFLFLVLLSAVFIDLSWLLWLSKELFFVHLDYRFVLFFSRTSWAFSVIQYQSLALFIESLCEKNYCISRLQRIFCSISCSLILFFIYCAFFKFNSLPYNKTITELQRIHSIYVLFLLIPITIYATIKKIRQLDIPKILRRQLKVIFKFLLLPYLLTDFIQLYPFCYPIMSNNAVISISSALLTYAIIYCARTIMGLRFLNLQEHVQAGTKFNFIIDFKNILHHLSHLTSLHELSHITQSFFKDAFNIPTNATSLYIRKLDPTTQEHPTATFNTFQNITETFLNQQVNTDVITASWIKNLNILITDEIAFNNFYEVTPQSKVCLQFLEQINADIFLPIFENNIITAYIIVNRNARNGEFYSNVERDEMLVFARYIGNSISVLHNKNMNLLLKKEKDLREILYSKHQEINLYKESMQFFLRNIKECKIGIIFYKNRHFSFGNHIARELINIDLNQQEGHQVTQSLRLLVHYVDFYKTSQTKTIKDTVGNQLIISAIPHVEQKSIILVLYYPEVSDIIRHHIESLNNSSDWDYLLYLETTKIGFLLHQLIPSNTPLLLQTKIILLKLAISKKPVLLSTADEDLLPIVELLHYNSLRETLYTLKLHAPVKNADIALNLFGTNLTHNKLSIKQTILEKLNNGTLFIQNIHFLDLESQEYLAELIKYGYYHLFKSDQKVQCTVRIICSTNQNLNQLAQEQLFSKALLYELKNYSFHMPCLNTLPSTELYELIDGYTQHAVQSSEFHHILLLHQKDKDKIISHGITSLQQLKLRVQQELMRKSKRHNLEDDIHFDPAYTISDPELVHIARLGKKALRDAKIMNLLWSKFKSQNKIAAFLGVNRSSINRRCKEYNLG